jgi:hypothetical protein
MTVVAKEKAANISHTLHIVFSAILLFQQVYLVYVCYFFTCNKAVLCGILTSKQ